MWIQKDKLTRGIDWSEVLDWVAINGVLWIEVSDKEVNEVCTVRC
jgi:hypothetical protein